MCVLHVSEQTLDESVAVLVGEGLGHPFLKLVGECMREGACNCVGFARQD